MALYNNINTLSTQRVIDNNAPTSAPSYKHLKNFRQRSRLTYYAKTSCLLRSLCLAAVRPKTKLRVYVCIMFDTCYSEAARSCTCHLLILLTNSLQNCVSLGADHSFTIVYNTGERADENFLKTKACVAECAEHPFFSGSHMRSGFERSVQKHDILLILCQLYIGSFYV